MLMYFPRTAKTAQVAEPQRLVFGLEIVALCCVESSVRLRADASRCRKSFVHQEQYEAGLIENAKILNPLNFDTTCQRNTSPDLGISEDSSIRLSY